MPHTISFTSEFMTLLCSDALTKDVLGSTLKEAEEDEGKNVPHVKDCKSI